VPQALRLCDVGDFPAKFCKSFGSKLFFIAANAAIAAHHIAISQDLKFLKNRLCYNHPTRGHGVRAGCLKL
jgi:hypothetical protein